MKLGHIYVSWQPETWVLRMPISLFFFLFHLTLTSCLSKDQSSFNQTIFLFILFRSFFCLLIFMNSENSCLSVSDCATLHPQWLYKMLPSGFHNIFYLPCIIVHICDNIIFRTMQRRTFCIWNDYYVDDSRVSEFSICELFAFN